MPKRVLPPADDPDDLPWSSGVGRQTPLELLWRRPEPAPTPPERLEAPRWGDHQIHHGWDDVDADDGFDDRAVFPDAERNDGFEDRDGFAGRAGFPDSESSLTRNGSHASYARGPGGRPRPSVVSATMEVARRHLAVLLVAAVVAIGIAATYLFRAHDTTVAVPGVATSGVAASGVAGASEASGSGHRESTVSPTGADGSASTAGEPTPSASHSAAASTVTVQVLGPVRRPGVVTLKDGARVKDALAACGGLLPDADPAELNLAAILHDADQIVIGTRAHPRGDLRSGSSGTSPDEPAPSSGGSASTTAVVNLNTATATDLDTLPGVGPSTAQRILAWRAQHGRFTSVSELQEIDGIGPKSYARLAPHVRV